MNLQKKFKSDMSRLACMTGSTKLASNYRWLVMFACMLSCCMYYYALQSVPPLLNTLQAVFNIDGVMAGLFMSIMVIPGLLMALPAGLIVNKFGFRRIGFLSLICISLGSFFVAFSTEFYSALFGRLIMGFGSCFLTIGTAATIPHWFKNKELGLAMGIYSIGFIVSTIVAFSTVPLLEEALGWQSPFYLSAIGAIVCAVFFVAIVKDTRIVIESGLSSFKSGLRTMKNIIIWKIGVIWLFYSVASSAFVTWAPSLLSTYKGLTTVDASLLSSLYLVSQLFFVPFYGWLYDRKGNRKTIMIAGLLGMALSVTALIYLNGLMLIPAVLIVGAFASAVPALTFAWMAESMPLKQTGVGFGMTSFWNRTATVIAAPLIGFLLGTAQPMISSFVCISIFAVLGIILILSTK